MSNEKTENPQSRNLTDADVQALADAMEERLSNRFYSNLGRGAWGLAWKIIVVVVLWIAVQGSNFKGFKL